MKQKYYVHMGPKGTEEVPRCWKFVHLLLFLALFGVSIAASYYIYSLLESFNYNCILYGKLVFQKSKSVNVGHNTTTQEPTTRTAIIDFEDIGTTHLEETQNEEKSTNEDYDLVLDYLKDFQARENRLQVLEYPEGWIAERSSVFATNHMCNLMLFPLITTTILSIMLLVWVCLSARGGRAAAGDLMPSPWLCVYPIIVLCCIMLIFSIITDRLFRRGCHAFCLNYKQFTNVTYCSSKIDKYTAQFNNGKARPWHTYFTYSYILVKAHTALWSGQLFLYGLRILCLADFNIYITRIRPKLAPGAKGMSRLSAKDMPMANLVLRAMQKQKEKEASKKNHKDENQKTV